MFPKTNPSLIVRLRDRSDATAWERFVDLYRPAIVRFLERRGLGPCEDAGIIGVGGMGVVLKGFDRALNRFVAVKVLAPQLAASAMARRRFSREAQAAAAVVHENVVAIHSVAEANGLPYLVMPYIRGASLQRRLKQRGVLTTPQVLRIGHQVAAGLAATHAQGLVHRDIKPGNILIEDGVDRLMLTDFGLARAVDDASVTQEGSLAGTPQYMSPEQARGEALDARSDMFRLGSVLNDCSPDDWQFATSCESGQANIWRVTDGKYIAAVRDPKNKLCGVRFLPDGQLATLGWNSGMRIWQADNAIYSAPLPHFGFQGEKLTAMEVSPDGSRIACGSQDGVVRLWDIASRTVLAEFPGDETHSENKSSNVHSTRRP